MTNLVFYLLFCKNILKIFINFFLFSFETKKVKRIFYEGMTEKVYTYTIIGYVIKI